MIFEIEDDIFTKGMVLLTSTIIVTTSLTLDITEMKKVDSSFKC